MRTVRIASLLPLLLLGLGCGDGRSARMGGADGADSTVVAPRQTRELIFVGQRNGEPLVAPIAFRTLDSDRARAREIRGWLGHGSSWETFLDERWTAAPVGSPWTIVPHGDLRLAAGPSDGVESLWFRRDGRRLHVEIGQPLGQWNRSPTARMRLFSGTLSVGGEATRGTVLELLRLRRPGDDPGLTEQLLVASGDSITLLVARGSESDAKSAHMVWMRNGDEIGEWGRLELVASGGKAIPAARREIPRRWTLSVPEAGLRGEVRSLGFAAEIGAERAGRHGVVARFTVTGWIELDGRRVPVAGMVRHTVE